MPRHRLLLGLPVRLRHMINYGVALAYCHHVVDHPLNAWVIFSKLHEELDMGYDEVYNHEMPPDS